MVIMIILLMLCLPLILMLSLFTATEVVSIAVDVPVNGIDVVIEELVELDLDKGESFEVDYVVSPTEAKNKEVSFIFAPLGDARLATFTVDGNTITPTSYGSARVIVETVDGGYRDSFDVVVYSKRVEAISSSAERDTLTVGETTKILTEYYPAVVRDEGLSYRVIEGEGIVSVTQSGLVRATGIGTAVIEVSSKDNPEAKSTVTFTVVSSGVVDFVNDRCDVTALENIASIQAVVNPEATVYDYALTIRTPDGTIVSADVAVATLDLDTGLINCHFVNEAFVGDLEIVLYMSTSCGDALKICSVHRISKLEIGWADTNSDGRYVVFGSNSDGERIEIKLRPLGADVYYFITLDYTVFTDINGNVNAGQSFELVEGTRYVADGGILSVELETNSEGVFLIVRGEGIPSLDDVDLAVTEITLTVVSGYDDGTVTVLDKISVVVY